MSKHISGHQHGHDRTDNRRPPGPETAFAATLILLFGVAQLTDQWTFHHFAYSTVYQHRWGVMLRGVGYLPLWGVVALALVLQDWVPRARRTWRQASRRGLLLFWSPAFAGVAAEVLKLIFRRERPNLTDGAHVFRAWSDQPWSTAQLGLPSSETAVAFAAAAVLARLFPEARWVWYGIALGCALTRVVSGAHFISDVVFAALVGYVVTLTLWRRHASTRLEAADEPLA
jgi:membrane-associated phospholipid phosphatase